MEPGFKRFRLVLDRGASAPKVQAMRHVLTAFLVVAVFSFGMSASMAQQSLTPQPPRQMDPGTIQVNPPPQPPPMQMQTKPAPLPNTDSWRGPSYDWRRPYDNPRQQR